MSEMKFIIMDGEWKVGITTLFPELSNSLKTITQLHRPFGLLGEGVLAMLL